MLYSIIEITLSIPDFRLLKSIEVRLYSGVAVARFVVSIKGIHQSKQDK
jgi:hypothetical protein